jgi:Uma2 family endonuclease
MAKEIHDEVAYYYDFYPTEEDLMGDNSVHLDLMIYLLLVLRWLFHDQQCAVYGNLNFYQTSDPEENPLVPDVAVIKGVEYQDRQSWSIGRTGPAPQVVFEIASPKTWLRNDLQEKPYRYARMGVQEYFAYDPNERPILKEQPQRLFGWRLDPLRREMREMPLRPDGSLWSIHLKSFLMPDGKYLRLYDQQGNMRLTKEEAEARRAEAEARRVAALAEKLRSLGIDPDQL